MRNCKTGYGKNKKYSGAKGVTGTGLRRFKEKCLDWLGLLEQLVTVKVRRSRSRTKKKNDWRPQVQCIQVSGISEAPNR